MHQTVYNPQKGRLETIDITLTDTNTTWFDAADDRSGVSLIADVEGGLLIGDGGYSYPVLIHDLTRSDINHDRKQAQELRRRYTS